MIEYETLLCSWSEELIHSLNEVGRGVREDIILYLALNSPKKPCMLIFRTLAVNHLKFQKRISLGILKSERKIRKLNFWYSASQSVRANEMEHLSLSFRVSLITGQYLRS